MEPAVNKGENKGTIVALTGFEPATFECGARTRMFNPSGPNSLVVS